MLIDPGELAGLPNVRRPGYRFTVYVGQLLRCFTKPAFRRPWCKA